MLLPQLDNPMNSNFFERLLEWIDKYSPVPLFTLLSNVVAIYFYFACAIAGFYIGYRHHYQYPPKVYLFASAPPLLILLMFVFITVTSVAESGLKRSIAQIFLLALLFIPVILVYCIIARYLSAN